jgi:hypothetical protein
MTGTVGTPVSNQTYGAGLMGSTDSTTPAATGSTTPPATSVIQPSMVVNYIIKT